MLLQAAGAGLTLNAIAAASVNQHSKNLVWHDKVDVIVCGSGAAGCTAALFAAKNGANVILLEKSAAWGGTTAKSGFHIWIPNHHELRSQGIVDDRESCLQYMAQYSYPHLFNPESPSMGLDQRTFELLAAFFDHAADTVEKIMDWDVCQFKTAKIGYQQQTGPDYHETSEWNKLPKGRGLMADGPNGNYWVGSNVMVAFREALLKLNVDIRMRHRASELILNDNNEVIGLVAENKQGEYINIRCNKGVVFGTGCYSHNTDLLNQSQMMPVIGSCAVPTNEGDFIPIAAKAGAQMGNMSGAWRAQAVLEHTIAYKSVMSAAFWPVGDSSLLVNKKGIRCVNEKRNYNDRAKALYEYDANLCEFPNLITFMIYDQRCADILSAYHPIPPDSAKESFVVQGDTLETLANNIEERMQSLTAHTGGVALDTEFSTNLIATIKRFNRMAKKGVDEDFGRGSFEYDQAWYEMFRTQAHPDWPEPHYSSNTTMHPLQKNGPYYAIILVPSTLGTNGGPVVNPQAQVLDYNDKPIQGLYAAGNCMAHPAANAYWAAGATIGTAMTFGRIAGESAAKRLIDTKERS